MSKLQKQIETCRVGYNKNAIDTIDDECDKEERLGSG